MKRSASFFAARARPSAPNAASWFERTPRIIERAFGSGLSGMLALLFFACTLLPLLHVAGDVPRGIEVRAVLSQSAGLPDSDAGVRVASVLTDLDEACEEAVQPRIVGIAVSRVPRSVIARSTDGLMATAAIPLDRPPRLTALG